MAVGSQFFRQELSENSGKNDVLHGRVKVG